MGGDRDIHVLLWGLPPDGPLIAVRNALVGLGADVTLFDQRSVLRARLYTRAPGAPGPVCSRQPSSLAAR